MSTSPSGLKMRPYPAEGSAHAAGEGPNALPLLLDYAAAVVAGPALAGGKGAQLGRLARYGLPVPEGFVISTAALVMDEELAAAARRAGSDPQALAAIRERLQARPLPAALAAALQAELQRRGWEAIPLAVRSSAPMEDSQRASFAGIHHSELDVTGFAAVAAAVQAVRASLWTPQAVVYRQRLGIEEAGMAVVVMPMLPAVAAGVAFSCDPASGRDDWVVVNAVAGLADALVSGRVSGEEIVLEADPFSEDYALLRRGGPASGLADQRAVELAELVRETAFCLDYGAPFFDIEWVWDGERFHLVQARPVTARPWHTYPALAGQAAIWSNGNTRDAVPHVMSALEWSTSRRPVNMLIDGGWKLAGYPVLPGAQRAGLFAGRLYLNVSLIQWEAYDAVGVAPAVMNRLLGGHHPDIPLPPASLKERAVRLGRMLRYLARAGRMRRLGRRQIEEIHATCAVWRAEDLAALDAQALGERLYAQAMHGRRQGKAMFLQGSSGGSLSLLLDLIERYLPGEGYALAAALMAGGEPSVTARQAYELQALAATAAREPEVAAWLRAGESDDWQSLPEASPFRRRFAAFIERYGHRAIYESYLRNPRWREAPGYLLRRIADLLDSDPAVMRKRQEAARAAARARLARHLPWWARRWAEALAKAATLETNDREAARSALTAFAEPARLLLLEIGRRLVASMGLAAPDDVFHLAPPEILAALAGRLRDAPLRHRVADRRRLCAEWEANPAPDVVFEGTAAPQPAPAPTRADGNAWRGTAVGAGLAAGPARVIHRPEDGERLGHGEILVAPSTDPAWTPLFLKAGGLVMETGGYLSHGAIVAREFGIPAVVNLPGILKALADGERLEVDGGRGTVRRISN